MDGTLIDSMGMIMELDRWILNDLGLPFNAETAALMRYLPLKDSAKLLCEKFDLPYSIDEIEKRMYDSMRRGYLNVEKKVGVDEYLDFCRIQGIKLAIATATEPEIAFEVAERLGLSDKVDLFISCSEVGASKDKPDVFVEAARRMGLTPDRCVVFEDGLPGIRSAASAGFKTVGVRDASSTEEDAKQMMEESDIYIYFSFKEVAGTVV